MDASWNGHLTVVKLLLVSGANVNARDKEGSTALLGAARQGRTEVVSTLIQSGADPDAKDNDGKTVLMTVSFDGSTEMVRWLLETSRSKHSGQDGFTPLMYASVKGRFSGKTAPGKRRGRQCRREVRRNRSDAGGP